MERTLRACTPLADQPGATMTPLHIEFHSQLEDAVKSGAVQLINKTSRRTSSTSRHSTSRQSRKKSSARTASSSAADTDGSSATPDASIPGKYCHSLPSRWFKCKVPHQFRQLCSSSISQATVAHYTTQVDAWFSFCSTQNLNPLSPSVNRLVEYLSIRSSHTCQLNIQKQIENFYKVVYLRSVM